VGGNAGRLVITTENPETSVADLQTVRVLARICGAFTAPSPCRSVCRGELTGPGVVPGRRPSGRLGLRGSGPITLLLAYRRRLVVRLFGFHDGPGRRTFGGLV
jgi:hypothetical protein